MDVLEIIYWAGLTVGLVAFVLLQFEKRWNKER